MDIEEDLSRRVRIIDSQSRDRQRQALKPAYTDQMRSERASLIEQLYKINNRPAPENGFDMVGDDI